jgi:hypothetical protein
VRAVIASGLRTFAMRRERVLDARSAVSCADDLDALGLRQPTPHPVGLVRGERMPAVLTSSGVAHPCMREAGRHRSQPRSASRSRCLSAARHPLSWASCPEPMTAGHGRAPHCATPLSCRGGARRTSCPVRCVDDARARGQPGAIVVTVPAEPRYLSAPFSTKRTPPPLGLTDGTTSALAMAMTPLPAPNWLPVRKPMLPPAPDL